MSGLSLVLMFTLACQPELAVWVPKCLPERQTITTKCTTSPPIATWIKKQVRYVVETRECNLGSIQ
jgi:hypothetical protein